MNITINGKEKELVFTFNSFKYMQDLDLSVLQEAESKPFKIVPFLETLLLGALNSNPKDKYTIDNVSMYLEDYIVEGDVTVLLEDLMKELEESNFFKSLQRNQVTE